MTTDQLRRIITADELSEAPRADVLLYGLTLEADDPAMGVLVGVRDEIVLMTSLAEQSHHHPDFDLTELVPVLGGIGRRLDVVIELLTRARRAVEPKAPAEPEAPTEPEAPAEP